MGVIILILFFALFGVSGVFGIKPTDIRADTGVCPYTRLWLPSFRRDRGRAYTGFCPYT